METGQLGVHQPAVGGEVSSSISIPARKSNAGSDSSGYSLSQSSKSIAPLDSPSASSNIYTSLQYAPRQRLAQSHRNTQTSSQSHTSSWGQPMTINAISLEAPLPSLLTADSSSIASPLSPVLSTMAPDEVPSSVDSSTRESNQVDAAERLAKQQMRTDAERLGLNAGSVGWAILDRVQSAVEGEWRELGEMLNRGEATLLLPTSPLKSSEVTLSHAYNHTIFSIGKPFSTVFASSSDSETSVVTLKGLRAELIHKPGLQSAGRFEFRSFIPRDDMAFVRQMKVASRRADLFNSLAPLPALNFYLAPFPSFDIVDFAPSLLLPPSLTRGEASVSRPTRPPSQPRVGSASTFLSPEQQGGLRPSASFATLFGGGRREKRLSGEEGKELKGLGNSGGGANVDEDVAATGTLQVAQPTRSISVAIIDGEVRRGPILTDIVDRVKTSIRMMLGEGTERKPLPSDIVDVVCSFAALFIPPSTLNVTKPTSSTDQDVIVSPTTGTVLHMPFSSTADQLADSFQDLFNSVKSQLEKWEGGEGSVEQEVDRVESVICSQLYDRIFCPYSSLDIFHDEALSFRIEALNQMGISLHHLGLLVPESSGERETLIRAGLEDMVTRGGVCLQSLSDASCVSPGDKLAALVAAHKIIVEELGKLPRIELIEEAEAASKEDSEEPETPSKATTASSQQTSSADLILPILIFCIIKSNPSRLVSNLLYIQRFRAEALIQGEASYCLVNVQAAVAFLENVEPVSLGLSGTVDLVTAKDLEQRRWKGGRDGAPSTVDGSNSVSMPMRMRSRVAHEVGELAGISNRVITGVLGSSLGAFGKMMGAGTNLAMGFDASRGVTTSKAAGETQSRKKSVEEIRGVLSGGAAAKLGSVLNRVIAMENEGKVTSSSRDSTEFLRPKLATRASASKVAATDYGRAIDDVRGESGPTTVTSSSKASISDRLASLPILSRTNTSTTTQSPSSTLRIATMQDSQAVDRRSASPTQPNKDLSGSPFTSIKGNHSRLRSPTDTLHPAHLSEALFSPTTPTSQLHPSHFLSSPTRSAASLNASSSSVHIPSSLQSPYPALTRPPSTERPLHVVLASTGSVASVKIPLMIEALLRHHDVQIQVISTKDSSRFYDTQSLMEPFTSDSTASNGDPYCVEALAQENKIAGEGKVESNVGSFKRSPRLHFWTDEDDKEQWGKVGDPILHIELRRWADVVLIAPCSANTLAKINAGICDNLLTNFLRALSPSTPTYLFPAMNTLMYLHPLTARHLDFVRDVLGYHVIGPIAKRLACGDLGQGAMQEWSDIVDLVVQRYSLVKD
ncbi:hypothetical protein CBS101457_004158 [Exobasidium rhododendri]|nr:hypothetical protein CBS101457_004158 [Exobasidium rhododendri]